MSAGELGQKLRKNYYQSSRGVTEVRYDVRVYVALEKMCAI